MSAGGWGRRDPNRFSDFVKIFTRGLEEKVSPPSNQGFRPSKRIAVEPDAEEDRPIDMKRTILAVVLGLALASCGAAAEPSSDGGDYDGEWRLLEGRGPDGRIPKVNGYDITLVLDNDSVSGRAACNSYDGKADIDGASFRADAFSMTEMGCAERVMTAEARYVDALTSADTIHRTGDSLTITGPDVRLSYGFVTPPPTAHLENTRWRFVAMVEGRGGDGVAFDGDPAALFLHADGTMVGSTGCRRFEARWTRQDDVILVSRFKTEGQCHGSKAQDRHMTRVLGTAFSTEIEEQSLTAYEEGSDLGLIYNAGR